VQLYSGVVVLCRGRCLVLFYKSKDRVYVVCVVGVMKGGFVLILFIDVVWRGCFLCCVVLWGVVFILIGCLVLLCGVAILLLLYG